MSIVRCPACGWENLEPEPEWVDEREVVEEVCEPCAVELYGDDETRAP